MDQCILFWDRGLNGYHQHLFTSVTNLDDTNFNDQTSSFVILGGQWRFYRDNDFGGPASDVFGPGIYSWVEDYGIPNDSISSVQLVG